MIEVLINVFLVWVCCKQLAWYNKHQRQTDLAFGASAAACLETGEKLYERRYRMLRAADDAEWNAYRAARLTSPELTVQDWNRGARS